MKRIEAVTGPSVAAALAGGAFWTLGGYGLSQAIRFGTSMVLTRLLAPELFGIMLVVNMVRTGVELLSDIGISQSVIRSPNGDEPEFYNTAWTLQILRGLLLAILCTLAAIPVALAYDIPIVASLLPVAALTLLISGFTSMALPLLRRRLDFPRLAAFEIATAAGYSLFQIAIAYVYPSVWALVLGLIVGSFITAGASFRLVRDVRLRLRIHKAYFKEIFSFGKWITLSSAVFFVTANFDRIFLPSVMSLQTLGIYSIARTVTDIIGSVFVRLSNSILFPYVASRGNDETHVLRSELAPVRARFLIGSALAIGALVGSVDLLIAALFDQRYHAAGWMASLLVVGAWFAILAQSAESSLMGLGRPQTAALANALKLVWLVVALPFSYATQGLSSAIAIIALSEAVRYAVTIPSQRRWSFSFLKQDALATILMFVSAAVIWEVRSFAGLPLPVWL